MVGTSLDGVDVVCAQIGRPFRFSVDFFRHIPFNATVRSELLQVIQSETLPLASLPALNHAVGEMLGETVNLVLRKHVRK